MAQGAHANALWHFVAFCGILWYFVGSALQEKYGGALA
jgi:hypothetical protein